MAQNVLKFRSSIGTRFYVTGITSRGNGFEGPLQMSGGARTVYAKGFAPESPDKPELIDADIIFGKGYAKPGIDRETGEPYPVVTWEYVGSESVTN